MVKKYYNMLANNELSKFYVSMYILFLTSLNLILSILLANQMFYILSLTISVLTIIYMLSKAYMFRYYSVVERSLNQE